MRARYGIALVAGLVLLGVSPTLGAIINVPADYPTIQDAIDAAPAAEHNVIYVAAGTYPENLSWHSTSIELIGAGAAVTIVDGGDTSSCLWMYGVPDTARVEGFTFTGGLHPWDSHEG